MKTYCINNCSPQYLCWHFQSSNSFIPDINWNYRSEYEWTSIPYMNHDFHYNPKVLLIQFLIKLVGSRSGSCLMHCWATVQRSLMKQHWLEWRSKGGRRWACLAFTLVVLAVPKSSCIRELSKSIIHPNTLVGGGSRAAYLYLTGQRCSNNVALIPEWQFQGMLRDQEATMTFTLRSSFINFEYWREGQLVGPTGTFVTGLSCPGYAAAHVLNTNCVSVYFNTGKHLTGFQERKRFLIIASFRIW